MKGSAFDHGTSQTSFLFRVAHSLQCPPPQPHTTYRTTRLAFRGLHSTRPQQIWPLALGVGVATVVIGAKYIVQAVNNPRFQEAMRGDKASPKPDQATSEAAPAAAAAPSSGRQAASRVDVENVLGIDLGASSLRTSIFEGGVARILENAEGSRDTPFVVSFPADGAVLLGMAAKKQLFSSPSQTLTNIQHVLGRAWSDPAVQAMALQSPFRLIEGPGATAAFQVNGQLKTPVSVTALMLGHVRRCSEERVGRSLAHCALTVPAHFTPAQREAVQEAAHEAGMQVVCFTVEPVAAVTAAEDRISGDCCVVFDMGGISCSCSVLRRVEGGEWKVAGNRHMASIGGQDFDERVVSSMVSNFKKEHGIDLSTDHLAMQRLKEAAERAKKELSTSPSTEINLPFITADHQGPKHLEWKLSRSKFEELVGELMEAAIPTCNDLLISTGLSTSAVDCVVVVGGMGRVPKLNHTIAGFFNKTPVNLSDSSPEELVALGSILNGSRNLQ